MPNRPYFLFETTWKTVKRTDYEVVVLPWGAIEAHNLHLPYGTDAIQSEAIAAESARIAWEKGAKVVVLPTVPYGVNTGQIKIKLDINMHPSTQLALMRDVSESLSVQGFKKLVVLNGHGGNEFKSIIRELQVRFSELLVCLVNWYSVVDPALFFEDTGEHGSEMETSNLLHIAPQLVLPMDEAGRGTVHPFRIRALKEGWAWTPRDWLKATEDTGIGNPEKASAEKGRRYLAAVTEKIGAFLYEFAKTDLKLFYE